MLRTGGALLALLALASHAGVRAQNEPYRAFEFQITRATPGRTTPEVMATFSSETDPNLFVDPGALEISSVLGPIDPDTGYRLKAPNGIRYGALNISRTLSPSDIASGLTPLERWFDEVQSCVTSKSCREWPGAAIKNKGNGTHHNVQYTWREQGGTWVKTLVSEIKLLNIWPISYRRAPVTEGQPLVEVVLFKVEGVMMSSTANVTVVSEPALSCAASFAAKAAQQGETMEGGALWWGALGGTVEEPSSDDLSSIDKAPVSKEGGESTLETRVRELGNFDSETVMSPEASIVFVPGRTYAGAGASSVFVAGRTHVFGAVDPDSDSDSISDGDEVIRNVGTPIETWPPTGSISPDSLDVETETYNSLTEQTVEGSFDHLARLYGSWLEDLLTPSPYNPSEFSSMMGVVNQVIDRAAAAENPLFTPTPDAVTNILARMRQAGTRGTPATVKDKNIGVVQKAANPPKSTYTVDSFFDIWYSISPPGPDGQPTPSTLSAGSTAPSCEPLTVDQLTAAPITKSSTNEAASPGGIIDSGSRTELATGGRRQTKDDLLGGVTVTAGEKAAVGDVVSPDSNPCKTGQVKCWDGVCRGAATECPAPSESYEWDAWRAATFRQVVSTLKNTSRWSRTLVEGKSYTRVFSDGNKETCQGDVETYPDAFPTAIVLPKFDSKDYGQAPRARRAVSTRDLPSRMRARHVGRRARI
mmetsp:Transcript_55130/g.134978  ORF Transcript_55130/g.134978 Transcript_55130/m.134978 type:complete len:702 (-) Transcript_55130:229-2334(-)|eukprot:CAMPEP_0206222324 /NCGR_PEP_ID=MMETSP0047_2-20121206/5896_1 /ASSEMBLY_ACC=CAM_ASM_000192 /TAXON_ID=195065 /ORGANISM="Chroomonas mesostigmatica_cf, Strain CCMP1168" /LENGTH=701 /DNA_ID=CAMNT_0053645135 /DNA_START=22 /DNA_END=2127 /DNA_ORIENTATION=-